MLENSGTEDKLKMTENTQTKQNPEKANNTKHSKTKLAWFSRFLQHLTRKRGFWLIDWAVFYVPANTV